MNTSLAANASSLPRLESDLYESVVDKDGRYGGVIADERWAQEIKRLARERNAVILAHNYQLPEIQDIADYTGDSLGLSRIAAETDADVIVFCGVHFMAETAKILSPEKTVLIPDERAGCSLADSITADELAEWKAENPGALVVSYVNTTADVKALTDICCTSSNAVDVVKSIPEDRRSCSTRISSSAHTSAVRPAATRSRYGLVSATSTPTSTVRNSRTARKRTPIRSCSFTRSAVARTLRFTSQVKAPSSPSACRCSPPARC